MGEGGSFLKIFFCSVSFSPDVHMVIDASIEVTVQPFTKIGTEDDKTKELLCPERHMITLPLNGLNILFSTCETAFNHSTQIATDRYTESLDTSFLLHLLTLFLCTKKYLCFVCVQQFFSGF
jgi:hypothetical protein